MAAAPLGTGEAGSELSYDEFKQAVLEQQIRNARANGRQHYPPVPTSELDAVEAGHRMRTEAARNCRALLAAARLALEQAKAAQDRAFRLAVNPGFQRQRTTRSRRSGAATFRVARASCRTPTRISTIWVFRMRCPSYSHDDRGAGAAASGSY
jgi:hypothetical protein